MWTPFHANVPVVLDRVAVMPGHYVFETRQAPS